ncbi:hypothetical protein GGI11_001589 [Coemansia sp. RSA 2049]|nr:hypothetical protein GGI11_001589 [Coemansia sp. RSA 2049]
MSDLPQPTDPIGEHPERGSYVTPVHSQGQSVALAGYLSTPSAIRTRLTTESIVAHADDLERDDCRKKISDALKGKVDYITPLVLFNNLGLAASYHAFNAAASAAGAPAVSEGSSGEAAKGLFDDIASIAPKISGSNLQYPMQAHETMLEAGLVASSGISRAQSEKALTKHFESSTGAFYTALYALATFNGTMDDDEDLPHGFNFVKPLTTAAARPGCLTHEDSYLKHFGIPSCLGATTAVLNAMYRFLFYENGKYIAARFLDDINRQRHANINFARGFMDASLLPPGIAANPPPLARPTSGVQTQPTSIDGGAGDERESIAIRTKKRTKHRK